MVKKLKLAMKGNAYKISYLLEIAHVIVDGRLSQKRNQSRVNNSSFHLSVIARSVSDEAISVLSQRLPRSLRSLAMTNHEAFGGFGVRLEQIGKSIKIF
jgi:hypothetical protein